MQLLNIFIIPLIICIIHVNCEKCNLKNVNIFAYNDTKWSKNLINNNSYMNYNQLKSKPAIVIITRQDVPYLCKILMRKFTKTQMLFLTNNKISKIEISAFSDAKQLKTLDLSDNKLKSIKVGIFNDIQVLVYLDLSKNQISAIDQMSFDNMRNLKEINIANNKLTIISNRWFSNCPNLHKFDLSKNKITQLSYLTFLNFNSLLNATIDLSMNKMNKIANGAFENIMYINKLELQKNNLTDMPPFDGLRNGHILNLKGNKIKCLKSNTLKTLSRFEKVRMRSNEIEDNCELKNEIIRTLYHISFAT